MQGERVGNQTPNLALLLGIEGGFWGETLPDRGGLYLPRFNIWVDQGLPRLLESIPSEERPYVEAMAGVALSIGRLHLLQLQDAESGQMWPLELFEEQGVNRLLTANQTNPSLGDPYSLLLNGLEAPAVPYSQVPHYREDLETINRWLKRAIISQGPSASAQERYLEALRAAYVFVPERTSDLKFMHVADKLWVEISPQSPFLIFAEPTEPYQDPLRVAVGQDPQISAWTKEVREKTGLLPWRNFFEFRLMLQAEDMVRNEEVTAIRSTSRRLYATPFDLPVPVSLEFRHLFWASGQGAHPAKTAKNYPNFDNIREEVGYKNVIYTNMLRNAVVTELIPALRKYLNPIWIEAAGFSNRLTRARCLEVVAHEENHPFRKMDDTPLEELKSSVNGIRALMESGGFSELEINDIFIATVASSLGTREKMEKAHQENDPAQQRALEAYYRGDTILMSFLYEQGAFVLDDSGRVLDLNFSEFPKSVVSLSEVLETVCSSETAVDQIYTLYGDENIWGHFTSGSLT